MERTVTFTRLLAAPRALVFKAWTEPEHVARWWGPSLFTTRVTALEPEPGGAFDLVMTGPDGVGYPMRSRFDTVTPPERLSFTFEAEGPVGLVALKGRVEASFAEKDAMTELTIVASATGLIPHAAAMLAGMQEGWSQTLDRLAAHVETSHAPADGPTFTITRTFDAPRELVFKVFSEAEHLARWWGPSAMEWVKGELDFRPGGQFHYCMRMPGAGAEMWGKFLYEEIIPPERVVFYNGFSDGAGNLTRHPMAPVWPLKVRNVLTLEDVDGRTRLTLSGSPFEASEAEKLAFGAMFESMNMGFGGTLDQLQAYLTELQKG